MPTYSDAGKNPVTGRRKMIEKGGYASEHEAYDAGVAAYADWQSGNIGITSERLQLKDYLAVWLENVSRPKFARLSYEKTMLPQCIRVNISARSSATPSCRISLASMTSYGII